MDDLLELTGRAEATHFWFRGFRAYVDAGAREIAAGRRDLRLIDCGCGTGNNLSMLKPYGEAFGFDLTAAGARRARHVVPGIAQADIERIPFKSGTFDIATSFDVVQSVPDDGAALREMARLLKPGGYAVLNVTALELLRADHSRGLERAASLHTCKRRAADRRVWTSGGANLVPVRVALSIMLGVRMGQRMLRPFRNRRATPSFTCRPSRSTRR
jgi:SAM-dependent methyltransferase